MALIKCPECGKEISNKAPACVHCGYPLDNSDVIDNKIKEEVSDSSIIEEDKKNKKTIIKYCLYGCAGAALVAMLVFIVCYVKNNIIDKKYIPDITIDEIDWSITADTIKGENYVVFKYTNNSEYTITSLRIELTEKENLSEKKRTKFYKAIQDSQGFDDEWMNKWIKSRTELKQPISMYAEADEEVRATETSDKIKCYYFGGWTSKNVIYNELFVPSKMIIKYSDGEENYTLYYNFKSKKYELETESKSESKTDIENKTVVEESTNETTIEESTSKTVVDESVSDTKTQNTTVKETESKNNEVETTQQISKNEEAVKSAEEIGNFYAMVSPYMVKDLLVSDYGYSESQAIYAITHANIDWNYYAVIDLEVYVDMNQENISKSDAEKYLGAVQGYSDAAIQYAFENANVDWRTEEEKLADKVVSSESASGTYIYYGTECTFSLVLYEDGTVIYTNDTANLEIYRGTWTQQGSEVSFVLQFQNFDEVEYYSSTLYTDGIQFNSSFYKKVY